MSAILPIEYLIGLINTDGSLYVDFKRDKSMSLGYALRPVIQISQQKLEKSLLDKIESTWEHYQIPHKYDETLGKNKTNRAPRIKVEGIANVKRCFDIFDRSKASFLGLKLVDYLLLKQIYELIHNKMHNTAEGRQKVLDLREHLHEPPVLPLELESDFLKLKFPKRLPKAKPPSNRLPRDVWEARHGFEIDSTIDIAKDVVDSFHQAYFGHCNQALKGITLHTDYVRGLLDGDGCIFQSSVTDQDFQITCDNGNEPLFRALAGYFSDKTPCVYGKPGSQVYVVRKETIVNRHQTLLKSLLTHKRAL